MANIIKFKFNHAAISADDKVQVLSFKGHEAISTLYEFDIELLSINPDLDIDDMLEQQASLEIVLDDDTRVIQGIIQDCQAVSQLNNQTLYRVKLVPKLWELSLYHTNEVYLEMSTVDVIEQVLKEAGFTTQDYDISGLQGDYPVWPYRCQYGENHLDFISRLMERDGIYYYFIEGEVGEKVIFCDSMQAQESISKADVLYSPAASLEINSLANNVSSFISKKTRLPYKVLLKDYNDDKPSVDIKGEAVVDERAVQTSEIYVWGQNIQTPEEGEALAKVRAEELQSTKSMYLGESSVARLLVGHHFDLKGHFRSACNQEYLLVSIEHEAQNPSLLDFSSSSNESSRVYQNTFSAIPASSQYRHPQITAKPEIHGTLNAFVDAEGDGHYAELDEEGRYRITLPFDRVDRDGGKASHWIRMSQPYGGEGHGMSFPLRKGAEVLLTFIGGDPDRPVIAGTVPNASQPSVTTSENQTNSLIKTGAGNKIELEDKDGANRIKLQTGDNKTYMHLGAPNHDGDGWVLMTAGIERKEVIGGQQYFVATLDHPLLVNENGDAIAANTSGDNDADEGAQTSGSVVGDIINEQTIYAFKKGKASGELKSDTFSQDNELSGSNIFSRRLGDFYQWTDGNEYYFGGGNVYNYGNSHEESYANPAGLVHTHTDEGAVDVVADAKAITNALGTGTSTYNLSDNTRKLDPENHFVEKIYADTFAYQRGRNFAWGDTCDYNFGNGYEENLVSETTINKNYDKDKAGNGGPGFGSITGDLVTLSEDTTCVGKMIGDTYEFVKGNTLAVVDGDSEEHVWGDSHTEVHGHAVEHVRGSCHTTHHGATNDMFMGATNEMFFGVQSATALAAANDMFVGAKNDLFIGAMLETCISVKTSINVGINTEIDTAAKFEAEAVFGARTKAVDVNATLSSIITEVNNISTGVSGLRSVATNLSNAGVSLSTGGINMIT